MSWIKYKYRELPFFWYRENVGHQNKISFKLNISCSYITFSSNESAFYNPQFRWRFRHSEVLYNFTVTYIGFFSIYEDFVSILHSVQHISRQVIHTFYTMTKNHLQLPTEVTYRRVWHVHYHKSIAFLNISSFISSVAWYTETINKDIWCLRSSQSLLSWHLSTVTAIPGNTWSSYRFSTCGASNRCL